MAMGAPRAEAHVSRGFSKNLLLGLAVAAAVLGAAEGVARRFVAPPDVDTRLEHERMIQVLGLPALNETMEFDPHLFWRLKPELRQLRVEGRIRDRPVSFAVTTHGGLRSPPLSPVKRGPRLLALGDSTTFGVGVEDRETWPAVLERRLRDEGIPAEVINAGVPGYTAYQGKVFLERRGVALRPDIVVCCFGFNDADRGMPRSDPETAALLALRRWEEPLLAYSRLYLGWKRAFGAWTSAPPPPEPRMRLSPDQFYRTLGEIHTLCQKAGADMIVLVWPYEGQVSTGERALIEHQIPAALFARNRGLPLVNLVDEFLEQGGSVFLDHVHANPAGCEVAARAVLRAVLEILRKREARAVGHLSRSGFRKEENP
jgi:lysophospholipase L1-like esterase